MRIDSDDSLAALVKYQLKQHKNRKVQPDNSDILIDSDDYNPSQSAIQATLQPKIILPHPTSTEVVPTVSLEEEPPTQSQTPLSTPLEEAPSIFSSQATLPTTQTKATPKAASTTNNKRHSSTPPSQPTSAKKSLGDLSRDYLRQKLRPIRISIEEFAEKENISYEQLLGLLLSYSRIQNLSEIGTQVWNKSISTAPSKVPVPTTLAIYNDCMLGRKTYTNMRKMLRATNCNAYAAWHIIREEQRKITPTIKILPEPHNGVYFTLTDAVAMTAQRILQLNNVDIPNGDLKMEIKFGFDGSGSHAIYNQINNADTNNIIMTMFCALKLITNQNTVIYEQPLPNFALSQRILCIQMGKETIINLNSLQV